MPSSPAKRKQQQASYYRRNKDKFKVYVRKYRKTSKGRESIRVAERDRRHGLKRGEYDQILAEQGGVCAICRKPPVAGKPLCVDHDHACCFVNGPGVPVNSCGKCIRGLLCHNCNQSLGKLNDDVDLLMAAVVYLKRGRRRQS